MDIATCTSCAMPMRTAAEHGKGEPGVAYCFKCATNDGELKPYDDVLEGMARFLETTQGLDASVARDMAANLLARNPAWR